MLGNPASDEIDDKLKSGNGFTVFYTHLSRYMGAGKIAGVNLYIHFKGDDFLKKGLLRRMEELFFIACT